MICTRTWKMIKAIWNESFKRSYKKRIKSNPTLKKKFWYKMELFLTEPFTPQLKTHKLGGTLFGLWSFSVTGDCRVIFEFVDNGDVLLIDVGKHDEVY